MASTDSEQQTDGLSLLEQAISHSRSGDWPAHLVPAARLAEGMPFLMQLANGDKSSLVLAKQMTKADEPTIRLAAVSYLKHMYITHTEDPYRVLGLNPWATYEEARERYRQLIRLFHPDRGIVPWVPGETDYSANINSAFSAVEKLSKEPVISSREQFQAAAEQKISSVLGAHRYKMRFSTPKSVPMRWMGWLVSATGAYKLSPRSVWLLLAFSGVLFLGLVYLSNRESVVEQDAWFSASNDLKTESQKTRISPPAKNMEGHKSVLQTNDTTPLESDHTERHIALNEMPIVTDSPVPVIVPDKVQAPVVIELSQAETKHVELPLPASKTVESVSVKKPPATVQTDTVLPKPKTKDISPHKPEKNPAKPPVVAELNIQTDLILSVEMTDRNISNSDQKATKAEADNVIVKEVLKPELSLTEDIQPYVPAKLMPSQDDLDRLVASFIGSYNEGDLAEFMNLMDDDLATDEPGGKSALRNAYMQVFRESKVRELSLSEFVWQRQGNRMVASSAYVSHLTSRHDGVTKTLRGHLRLEVSKKSDVPRISGFYQMADKGKR